MRAASLALALVLCAAPAAATQEDPGPEAAAQRAAETWLAVVDAEQYADSWTRAAALFREAVGQEVWVRQMASVRAPLGEATSRELLGAQYTTSLPNAPPGEYVVLQFRTQFAGRETVAVETVVPMKEGDGWKVSGYFIQ